jgi:hypothetical protein
MNRTEMIEYIRTWYGNWGRFYSIVPMLETNRIAKWFIAFEGHEPSDMYLCSKDPRGDDEGEIITCSDCFDSEVM